MEKRVKNYGREVLSNQSSKSKRQKLKMNAGKAANETDFHWNEVVDVCNVRYSCLQVVSHNETDVSLGDKKMDWSATNSNCKVYDLSSTSPGLFLVSGALTIEQQIYWASKAVEEYSTVEHNNLNNLQSIYGTTETDETTSSKVTPAKDIPNVEDLWINSVDEDIPFETFSKLRWSCLGYHYGTILSALLRYWCFFFFSHLQTQSTVAVKNINLCFFVPNRLDQAHVSEEPQVNFSS